MSASPKRPRTLRDAMMGPQFPPELQEKLIPSWMREPGPAIKEELERLRKTSELVERTLPELKIPTGKLSPGVLLGDAMDLDRPLPETPPAVAPRRGRPKGTSLKVDDQAIIEKMKALVQDGSAKSLTEAAKFVVGPNGSGAAGGGTLGSKIDRLVRRARAAGRE